MRQHQAHHLEELQRLRLLSVLQAKAALAISSHEVDGYVASEVLAMIVRSSSGRNNVLYLTAAESLNTRIHQGVRGLLKRDLCWRRLLNRDGVIEDTVMAVWDRLLDKPAEVSNSEVFFGKFVRDGAIDYLRSLMTLKASQSSYESLKPPDEKEGGGVSFIESVADNDGETPEEAAMRGQLHTRVSAVYLALPAEERYAVYFRLEQKCPWPMVGEMLKCSIPTARARYRAGLGKLEGEL